MSHSLFREEVLSKSNVDESEELLLKPRWACVYWIIAIIGLSVLVATYILYAK